MIKRAGCFVDNEENHYRGMKFSWSSGWSISRVLRAEVSYQVQEDTGCLSCFGTALSSSSFDPSPSSHCSETGYVVTSPSLLLLGRI